MEEINEFREIGKYAHFAESYVHRFNNIGLEIIFQY